MTTIRLETLPPEIGAGTTNKDIADSAIASSATAIDNPVIGQSASGADAQRRDADPDWTQMRDEYVANHQLDFDDDANLSERIPAELSFFAAPEQFLLAYEKHRETSELGRVFELANRWHDFLDAIVITGDGQTELAAKAILETSCDPFHNEGSRATRGSKPRFYFANDDWDNDYFQSLLTRLALGGYGSQVSEVVWALISLPGTKPAIRSHLMSRFPLAAKTLGDELQSRRLMSVAPANDVEAQQQSEIGFPHHLFVPTDALPWQIALSTTTLLPAAFLGLDCIQLLVGAAKMNDHFRTSDDHQNMVLQFARWNKPRRANTLIVWSSTLNALGNWATLLHGLGIRQVFLGHELGKRTDQQLQTLLGSGTCNHFFIKHIRTDSLSHDPSAMDANSSASVPTDSFANRLTETQGDLTSRLKQLGIGQTTTTLPGLDTNPLGQLFQMLMLANAISQNADLLAGNS